MRGLVGSLASIVILLWWFPSFVADIADFAGKSGPAWALRWSRRLCLAAVVAWVVSIVAVPPHHWFAWLLCAGWPYYWHSIHKRLHKDKHGRRLLDAANGLVERRGNRLAVVHVGGAR